jgi:hypothetical protein
MLVPTFWVIVAEVAFVLAQLSVDVPPDAIVGMLAENDPVGAGTTVTVTEYCDVPPGPVNVMVYVVVAVGLTLTLPEGTDTPLMPLLIDALVA